MVKSGIVPIMKLAPAMIAMDLDDTLLKHDLSISERTVETLQKASDRGIKLVLASGRSPEAMIPYAKRIGVDRAKSWLVCNNGSEIITSDGGERIYERRLPEDVAIEAYRLVVDAGLSCHVYENNVIHVSRETEYSRRDCMLSGLKPIVPADYEALIRRGVYKLVIPGDPEFIVPVEAEFKVVFKGRATVFVSKPYFLEILPFGAGKGEALEYLAREKLGVTAERVMAFGDSMNDESMIRYAGMSVAMSNSRPEILALAKRVTDLDNDADGLADFIEKNVL
jgi:Cof subfamily protein (haloacid dehalogenase superfamily)